jgi:hypothetical protein
MLQILYITKFTSNKIFNNKIDTENVTYKMSCRLLEPLEKVGSVNILYVYGHNRPLAPILRQKMALSSVCCLLTADVLCLRDRNTWSTFPGSGLNIY